MAKKNTTPDLGSILSEATETVNAASSDFAAPVMEATTEPAPVETAAHVADDFTEVVDEPTTASTDDEPTVLHSVEDTRKSARRYIEFVDNLQKPLLVSAYRKTILHPGDESLMESYELERAKRGKYSVEDAVSENDELYHAMTRAREFMQLCDSAPFTNDEKESLTGPLAEVLQKHQAMHLTPEMALLLAVAMVMLPRVAPLIPQFRKGFTL